MLAKPATEQSIAIPPALAAHVAVKDAPVNDRAVPVLGRIGPLEVRLARGQAEITAAQALRFTIFYEEMGAKGSAAQRLDALDADRFDAVCDHLLVFDTALPGPASRQIVGTYRLMREEAALTAGGFYTEDEFELRQLLKRQPGRRFLELGRSCVLPPYRSRRVVELLWQGIWAYCRRFGIDVMAGCASFPGTVPAAHAEALSFLSQHCRAEGDWAVRALPARYHAMDLMPSEAVDSRRALAAMPPLIKGYLRLGARIGDGCVVDHDFGTTDVLVVLPVETISARYLNYYGAEATRFAA